jgi:prepilin-type N-terminal cleavage/methylation domain-containing protein
MIKKISGFTLIESLMVMLILATSMTAALYLLSTVVFSTQQNIKRTKAVYMAQECVELARNLRDTAWANFRDWDCAFDPPGSEYVLSADYTDLTVDGCSSMKAATNIKPFTTTNTEIWQENTLSRSRFTHFPTETDAISTGYSGVLRHIDNSDPDNLELECEVSWEYNGRPQSVTASQTLTNWRKN